MTRPQVIFDAIEKHLEDAYAQYPEKRDFYGHSGVVRDYATRLGLILTAKPREGIRDDIGKAALQLLAVTIRLLQEHELPLVMPKGGGV